MSLTLNEIIAHEDRLRAEIIERKCLLAAFNVLHTHAVDGDVPQSAGLGTLVSALTLPVATEVQFTPTPAPALPAPAQAALPAAAPVEPYIHPELKAFGCQHGYGGKAVWWAIRRMTNDYTLHEIHALLKREGRSMRSSKISVVLSRLKKRGQIEEIRRGEGPHPAVYRKPEIRTGSGAIFDNAMDEATAAVLSDVAI